MLVIARQSRQRQSIPKWQTNRLTLAEWSVTMGYIVASWLVTTRAGLHIRLV